MKSKNLFKNKQKQTNTDVERAEQRCPKPSLVASILDWE